MSGFTYLHLHTHFSAAGGPASPDEWCRAAAELGYAGLGIADRGPLGGLPAFSMATQKAGLRPIYGMEISVWLPTAGAEGASTPVALFAQSKEGLANLARLAALAYAGWPKEEHALARQQVEDHSEGLVLVLLPKAGHKEASSPFIELGTTTQEEWVQAIKARLGENAFVGLPQPAGDAGKALVERAALAAEQMGLPLLAMPTARYLRAEDTLSYRALLAARGRAGWPVESAPYASAGEYLRPPAEVAGLFGRWPEAVENAGRIAALCSEVGYLHTCGTEGNPDERAHLEQLAEKGLRRLLRTESLPDAVQAQLRAELSAIDRRGTLPAWTALAGLGKQTPLLGAPLGTADGSLLGMALGLDVTSPDTSGPGEEPPIQGGDESRQTAQPLPGVEVPANRHAGLLADMAKEYGRGRAAKAACPVDIDPLTALWAASQTFESMSRELRPVAFRAISEGWEALVGAEAGSPAQLALSLRGAPLTFKPDPDTLLVSPWAKELPLWVPLLGGGEWVPWSEEAVAYLGLPALTLRPSAALALLSGALALASRYPVPGLAADAPDTLDGLELHEGAAAAIARGELLGIPYISASALKGRSGDITPQTISAIVARSLGAGKPFDAPKPAVWAEKTADTDGALLYVDQFRAVAWAAAGIGAAEAGKLRRAMLAEDEAAGGEWRVRFSRGCAERQIDEEGAQALWKALAASAAHLQSIGAAQAWGRTSLRLAALREMHPAGFIAAVLCTAPAGGISMQKAASEAGRLGVALRPPQAAYSSALPSLERDGPAWAVTWGLAALPGWDTAVAERFVAARPSGGFADLESLSRASVEAGLLPSQLAGLVRSGACDNIGGKPRSRDALLSALPVWVKWAQEDAGRVSAASQAGQLDLFSFSEAPSAPPPDEAITLQQTAPSPRERYVQRAWEQEHLGVGFTDAEELDALNRALKEAGNLRSRLLTTEEVSRKTVGTSVNLVGLLTSVAVLSPPAAGREGQTPTGPMATAWIEDGTGAIELVAFPPSYKRQAELWVENKPVAVTARVRLHPEGDPYLLCEHLAPFQAGGEEAEIELKVKPSGKKSSTQETGAEPALAPTAAPAVSGATSAAPHPNGHSNGHSSSHHTTDTEDKEVVPPTSSPNQPADRMLIITLPASEDEHADIDRMISLKELLYAHPGPDLVTLRIHYSPDPGSVTKVQLPAGVYYNATFEAQVADLLGPGTLAVVGK